MDDISTSTTPHTWHIAQPHGVAVHTGFPNPGIDATSRAIDLNTLLIQHSVSTFCFTISGDDWQHMGIFADDIAIVDRALDAGANDIIIWHHEGDFTISPRHRMRPDGQLWGVVTSIIHRYKQFGGAA